MQSYWLRSNNSFKPNLLRSTKHMAERACHVFGSTTQVGLTQVLGLHNSISGSPCLSTQPTSTCLRASGTPVIPIGFGRGCACTRPTLLRTSFPRLLTARKVAAGIAGTTKMSYILAAITARSSPTVSSGSRGVSPGCRSNKSFKPNPLRGSA